MKWMFCCTLFNNSNYEIIIFWFPSADDKLLSAAEMGAEGEEEDEEDFAVKIIDKKGRLRWREGSERIFDWKEAG